MLIYNIYVVFSNLKGGKKGWKLIKQTICLLHILLIYSWIYHFLYTVYAALM